MVPARIWGRDIEMQGSPWTFVLYKRAFGGDLLSDFLAATKKDPLELDDYLKVCWAMCRTRSDEVADFGQWCNGFPDFTLADGEGAAFVSVVDSAVVAELFRSRETRFQRFRRKLCEGRLGRLSGRLRSRKARILARRGARDADE